MAISKTVSKGKNVVIDESSKVWDFAYLGDFSQIGRNVIIGRGVYIGSGVNIGSNCKIQNNALIYGPSKVEDGVFIGPGVIFTNDKLPRSVNPDFSLKSKNDWEQVGVNVKEGASIGAGTICIAPLIIGSWSMIGAGSVVTKNVPDFALMIGNPATQIGWVSKKGIKLVEKSGSSNILFCPLSKSEFELKDNNLIELEK